MIELLYDIYIIINIFESKDIFNYKKYTCFWNTPPGSNKKSILSTKVKVRVTRSLTLVSLERIAFVKYACMPYMKYLSLMVQTL